MYFAKIKQTNEVVYLPETTNYRMVHQRESQLPQVGWKSSLVTSEILKLCTHFNLDELKFTIPRRLFFKVFFGPAPWEGREKPLSEVLGNSVQYKRKSGRPRPFLHNVKSRISTPPLTHRNFLAIRTVPSGELVQGPRKVPESYLLYVSF